MTALPEFRDKMQQQRAAHAGDAPENPPKAPLLKLIQWYRALAPGDRALADRVVTEWILSDNPADRLDGRVMCQELRIVNAVPALRELARRLTASESAEARYEQAAVERTLAALGELG